jgi:hypothetical protein
MLAVRRLPAPVLALLMLVLALAIAVPLTAAKGGNSDSAMQCRKGGWQSLASTSSPFVPFRNQGACVSAAAQGATLTTLAVTRVTVTRAPSGFLFMGRALCGLSYSVADQNPAYVSYDVTATARNGTVYEFPAGVQEQGYADDPGYAIASATAIAQPGSVVLPVAIVDQCAT